MGPTGPMGIRNIYSSVVCITYWRASPRACPVSHLWSSKNWLFVYSFFVRGIGVALFGGSLVAENGECCMWIFDWKNCADFAATYEKTSTTALSTKPAVAVPLLTINGWILMQRKVTGGSVSFVQNWAEYRDGFGSPRGNDNYWLGLDKVYRLVQMGSVRLRVEVHTVKKIEDVIFKSA